MMLPHFSSKACLFLCRPLETLMKKMIMVEVEPRFSPLRVAVSSSAVVDFRLVIHIKRREHHPLWSFRLVAPRSGCNLHLHIDFKTLHVISAKICLHLVCIPWFLHQWHSHRHMNHRHSTVRWIKDLLQLALRQGNHLQLHYCRSKDCDCGINSYLIQILKAS